MSDRTRMTADRLTAMIEDSRTPDLELDQAFWARDRGVDYPLTHYDEETWEACAQEGDPAARAISNPGALFRFIEERYPGHRLDIRAEGTRAKVSLLVEELSTGPLPIAVSGEFLGDARLSGIGRAVVIATIRADALSRDLQRRLAAVADLDGQAPRFEDWPIEEVSPGRWGAVHHGLRLLCATANSPDGAARHAGMNHKGIHGLMLCRERYGKAFPDSTPNAAVDAAPAP